MRFFAADAGTGYDADMMAQTTHEQNKYRKTLFSNRGQMVRGEPRRRRRTSRRGAEGTHCEVFARNSAHQATAEF